MKRTERQSGKACPTCGQLAITDSARRIFYCPGCENSFLVDKDGTYPHKDEGDVIIICPRCKEAWYSDIPGLFECTSCFLQFDVHKEGTYLEHPDSIDLDEGGTQPLVPDTFAQYLEKWLKQSTSQGLNNPLVKMPVKRFRLLQQTEFSSIANGGTFIIGTTSDPIARNLYKNYQTRIRERGEHCAFICYGAVEMTFAAAVGQPPRSALFPVCLKRASLQTSGNNIRTTVSDDEVWKFNPVLGAHLRGFGIAFPEILSRNPIQATDWIKAQLGNRASQITSNSYVGLLSSQQMVVQQRLTDPPLRQALARNPVVRAKIEGSTVENVHLGEIGDEGLEELGLVLPCDDSQLRVVQLAEDGCCLQVEGPPGTGKSQTITNIISNALYQGRSVLLVCDKKAAIVQVEERLTNCGLKPAVLNIHDEDLDKREFLKQATDKFRTEARPVTEYPFNQLQMTRKTLNDRVNFGRAIAHPSLQIPKRYAIEGLIQLRKELKRIPNIAIDSWHSLSKERLTKLLSSLAEWPGLSNVLTDATSVWNAVCAEAFEGNPNAVNELMERVEEILAHLDTLIEVREWAAIVGLESLIFSDPEAVSVLALIKSVMERPSYHAKLVGNLEVTLSELKTLQSVWERRNALFAARHPVPLTEIYPYLAEQEATELLRIEKAETWEDLSLRQNYHDARRTEIKESQDIYLRLCNRVGLVYSPLLNVRRAQLQALLSLGAYGGIIPRAWWGASTNPVLSVDGWVGKLRACIEQSKSAPLPLHFVALERIAATHWGHVEAMAEHGFNMVSYCLKYVNDRKCKYALRQAYPNIPVRGFKQWREVTLHATAALGMVTQLRLAAESHVILKHLTENYLSVAHDAGDTAERFVEHDDVRRIQNAAALVEQWRDRGDLFDVAGVHWQTFWESPNPSTLSQVESILSEFDTLSLPDSCSDNIEEALSFLIKSSQRIGTFLQMYEKQDGDRSRSVLQGFAAQKEFSQCNERLVPLRKYLELQPHSQANPDWLWLHEVIEWRDLFEQQRGQQKLDVDSVLWLKLSDRLRSHCDFMERAYRTIDQYFDNRLSDISNYDSLKALLVQILADIHRHPLWLEKKRWSKKIPAFPELKELWGRILDGGVPPEHAERLFCFNLLRLCDPIAKPQGPELRQTLHSFVKQDESLASWILDHLKSKLREATRKAAATASQSESELRRLSGLQRVRGTVRELVNAHVDYLRTAKPCWMMSPTSLANLLDSAIFEKYGIPFDMVIFDEASQIRVLDGLLSMSFGKQVIIVGDKNQLPPTDFFASFANADDETDTGDFGISESLLDEFSGVFTDDGTHVMLMSHYRSETPDLIHFSNNWFYDGRLEMYPPARVSGIGRRLHYVPGAVYSETAGQRSNPVEADEVVKLIELHVREFPEKSLGVVTMNIPQMELID